MTVIFVITNNKDVNVIEETDGRPYYAMRGEDHEETLGTHTRRSNFQDINYSVRSVSLG